jgi:hypothetical protein
MSEISGSSAERHDNLQRVQGASFADAKIVT